jgi:hypothetical protein
MAVLVVSIDALQGVERGYLKSASAWHGSRSNALGEIGGACTMLALVVCRDELRGAERGYLKFSKRLARQLQQCAR